MDGTTDVTNQAKISVILHYVVKTEADCEVKEAFLGFDDVSEDRCAPAIAEYVLGEFFVCVLLVNTLLRRAQMILVNLTDVISASTAKVFPMSCHYSGVSGLESCHVLSFLF